MMKRAIGLRGALTALALALTLASGAAGTLVAHAEGPDMGPAPAMGDNHGMQPPMADPGMAPPMADGGNMQPAMGDPGMASPMADGGNMADPMMGGDKNGM